MSFYWRWVVLVGGVAAIMSVLFQLLIAWATTTGNPWLAGSAAQSLLSALVLIPSKLAEAYVLKSEFPKLSVRAYFMWTIPLFLLAPLSDLGTHLTEMAFGPLDLRSTSDPSGALILLNLVVAVLSVVLMFKFLFLPWRAIGKVAEGRKSWRNWLLLSLLGTMIAFLVYLMLVGLEVRAPDFADWTDVMARLPLGIVASFAYALISGIGVARLRPKPEAAP